RQIIGGDEPLVNSVGKKPLSVAVEELNQGKIKILAEDEAVEEQESGAQEEAMEETQEQETTFAEEEEAEEQEA
ncbi:MAG: DNA-directed RNA polymerase subunit omega, partial [Acetatifactor sp.]|nr:DNA-directed RNA polymerase subunit omega [Acetatifactor sp.]